MNKKWTIVLVPLICLVMVGVVWAQTSPNYDNSWHVLSASGSQGMNSGSYTIYGTSGQFSIGRTASTQSEVGSGYWYGVNTLSITIPYRYIYLPLVLKGH